MGWCWVRLTRLWYPSPQVLPKRGGMWGPWLFDFSVSFLRRIQATWSQCICHHKALTRGQAYCSADLLWKALCDERRLGNLRRLCREERAAVRMAAVMPAAPAHFNSATWKPSKHGVNVMTERTQTRDGLAKLSTFKGEIFIFYILNSPQGMCNMFLISLVFKNVPYLKSKAGRPPSCVFKW